MDYKNLILELKDKFTGDKLLIVTDEILRDLYLKDLIDQLEKEYEIHSYITTGGESAKSIDEFLNIHEELSKLDFNRNDGIIALGGGTIGDLVGFVASSYLRGMALIQIPTTLLAQVDSSIGGKNGLNTRYGKNRIGSFYQPLINYTDITFLKSLEPIQIKIGMGEIIKYGIISGGELFYQLENPKKAMNNLDEIIKKCQDIKKNIIKDDLHDHGKRQVLNLGHSFGHGLELLSDYNLSHGEAVAMGIKIISDYSKTHGILAEYDYKKIIELLKAYDFNLNWRDYLKSIGYGENDLIDSLKADKKVRNNKINLVIIDAIGETSFKNINLTEISFD